jgi:hypothetical protein
MGRRYNAAALVILTFAVTTPILHFMVRCLNDGTYGTPTEEGYYSKLAAAFAKIKKSQVCTRSLRTLLFTTSAVLLAVRKQVRVLELIVDNRHCKNGDGNRWALFSRPMSGR